MYFFFFLLLCITLQIRLQFFSMGLMFLIGVLTNISEYVLEGKALISKLFYSNAVCDCLMCKLMNSVMSSQSGLGQHFLISESCHVLYVQNTSRSVSRLQKLKNNNTTSSTAVLNARLFVTEYQSTVIQFCRIFIF